MASEFGQMRATDAESAVEVESRERAAGALPLLFGARDQHDGPVESLDEARRDDPDHAFVPRFVGEDVASPPLLGLRPLLDLCHRLAEDPVLDGLPLAVELLEAGSELRGGGLVVGEQQLERVLGVGEAARSVDAWSEAKADGERSEERRVGKECRSRWSPY